MKFANIPNSLLDQKIGEGFDTDWTLRSEIEKSKEDIIKAEWDLYDNGKIRSFCAWSATFVHLLVATPFGDYVICPIRRNP